MCVSYFCLFKKYGILTAINLYVLRGARKVRLKFHSPFFTSFLSAFSVIRFVGSLHSVVWLDS